MDSDEGKGAGRTRSLVPIQSYSHLNFAYECTLHMNEGERVALESGNEEGLNAPIVQQCHALFSLPHPPTDFYISLT